MVRYQIVSLNCVSKMADMPNPALLSALRKIKSGDDVFGSSNQTYGDVLKPRATELGLDTSCADPSLGQFSCLLVHSGSLLIFTHIVQALMIYVPVHLLPRLLIKEIVETSS
jgi:hypothetical protein